MKSNVVVTNHDMQLLLVRCLEHFVESINIILELGITAPFALIKQIAYLKKKSVRHVTSTLIVYIKLN